MTPDDVEPPAEAERFRSQLLAWAEDHLRDFPWREPDATFYEVFVAEFFLTQTPAINVETVYPEFVEEYPDIDAIVLADESELVTAIRPLGFQNQRAAALKEIAETVDGALPREPRALRELPQVGEYVADATVCFALDVPLPIVDKNVRRVYSRLFGDQWPDSESDRRDFAEKMLPSEEGREYNLALLDFGSLVCQPRTPRCDSCFASDYCTYYQES